MSFAFRLSRSVTVVTDCARCSTHELAAAVLAVPAALNSDKMIGGAPPIRTMPEIHMNTEDLGSNQRNNKENS